jgi:transposase
LVLHALVTAANVQDRDGGILLLSTLFGQFPFLRKLFADSAYAGPIFHDGAAKAMRSLAVEIVKRADHAKGFVVEPKRWIVERSIAWLNRCRRLAKDWENRNHNGLAFLHLASIRLISCSEGSVILHEVAGRTLSVARSRCAGASPPMRAIWRLGCQDRGRARSRQGTANLRPSEVVRCLLGVTECGHAEVVVDLG